MKKLLWVFFLIFAVAMNSPFVMANPVDQLTGKIWMDSEADVKKAVLFGVDTAVAIEHTVAQKVENNKANMEKEAKEAESYHTISPFEEGWAVAFKDVPRATIVEEVDQWYIENPDRLDRPVMNVIWFEIIEPKLK